MVIGNGSFSLKLRKRFTGIKVVNEDYICYRAVNKDHVRYRKERKFLPQIMEAVMDGGNTRRFLSPLYEKHIGIFTTRRRKDHPRNLVFPEP